MAKINMNKTNFKSDARKLTAKELTAKKLKAKKSTLTYWEKNYTHLYEIFCKVTDELKETKESSTYWETRYNALREQQEENRGKYSKYIYPQEEMGNALAIWEDRYNALKKQFSDFRLEIALCLSEIKTELEDAQQTSELIDKQTNTTVLSCGCRPNIEICKKYYHESDCDICHPNEHIGD